MKRFLPAGLTAAETGTTAVVPAPERLGKDLRSPYRKNSNNRSVCYVVGVASSGKVWYFFVFLCFSRGLSSSVFAAFFTPFLKWVILDYIAHRPII